MVNGSAAVAGSASPPSTAVRELADTLRECIARGGRAPGSPLVEAELCSSYGVSRNTAREALRLLSAEGLATYVPHRGCVVAQLSETDAIDIYRVRRLLEIEAVLRSGTVPTHTLEAMGAAVDDLDALAAGHDWLGFVEADQRFHALLVGLLGSRRLDEVFAGMARELRLALSIIDRATMGAAVAGEQREIFRLLSDGRRAECAALLERHLDDAGALLVTSLREQRPQRRGRSQRRRRHPPAAGTTFAADGHSKPQGDPR
jgi:DNA-binding GntR family transcriptional regulator